jgi:hypothetical protein
MARCLFVLSCFLFVRQSAGSDGARRRAEDRGKTRTRTQSNRPPPVKFTRTRRPAPPHPPSRSLPAPLPCRPLGGLLCVPRCRASFVALLSPCCLAGWLSADGAARRGSDRPQNPQPHEPHARHTTTAALSAHRARDSTNRHTHRPSFAPTPLLQSCACLLCSGPATRRWHRPLRPSRHSTRTLLPHVQHLRSPSRMCSAHCCAVCPPIDGWLSMRVCSQMHCSFQQRRWRQGSCTAHWQDVASYDPRCIYCRSFVVVSHRTCVVGFAAPVRLTRLLLRSWPRSWILTMLSPDSDLSN